MRKGLVVEIINEYESNQAMGKGFSYKRNEIVIEHKDGSFARYIGLDKNSIEVKLGQTVYPQTKLGTAVEYEEGSYKFSFGIYYRVSTDYKKFKKSNFKNQFFMNAYVDTYFLTQMGAIKIQSGEHYSVEFNEEVLTKEFSRKERKKFKKDPTLSR